MQHLVKCRRCGWVHYPVTSAGEGNTHCFCGAPSSAETMEPTDGADLPLGATLNPIVVIGHSHGKEAEESPAPS